MSQGGFAQIGLANPLTLVAKVFVGVVPSPVNEWIALRLAGTSQAWNFRERLKNRCDITALGHGQPYLAGDELGRRFSTLQIPCVRIAIGADNLSIAEQNQVKLEGHFGHTGQGWLGPTRDEAPAAGQDVVDQSFGDISAHRAEKVARSRWGNFMKNVCLIAVLEADPGAAAAGGIGCGPSVSQGGDCLARPVFQDHTCRRFFRTAGQKTQRRRRGRSFEKPGELWKNLALITG
jgi:hypothetical protein